MPWQVVVGPKGLAEGKVELKRRATGERSRSCRVEDAVVAALLGLRRRMSAAAMASASGRPQGTRPFARFEWMVARRYLRARRREGFISVIAGFSFLGIMLGRRDADHRDLGDERLPQRAAQQDRRHQRPHLRRRRSTRR